MLQPFDIVFHKGKTPIARFIRLLTHSKYSHCAIAIDSIHLVQLDWKTPVSIQHLNYPLGHYDVFRIDVELTNKEKDKVLNYIRERIQTTYDWKLIFSRFFNIIIGTPIISSKKKYNCDELIIEAFRHIGINLITSKKFTPDSLSKSHLLSKVIEVKEEIKSK